MLRLIFAFYISISSLCCSEISYEKEEHNKLFLFLCSKLNGNLDILKALIAMGANINYTISNNITALHSAVDNGCLETVKFLLQQKSINIEAKMEGGQTALHLAAIDGNYEITKLLIQKGAHINAESAAKVTPLHYAANEGDAKTVKFLIQNGALVNAKDSKEGTPLYYATRHGDIETVKVLLQNGADINASLADGTTPLMLALSSNNTEIVKLLLSQESINVNGIAGQGITALDIAFAKRYHFKEALSQKKADDFESIIQILVQKGAKFGIINFISETALEETEKREQAPIPLSLKELSSAESNTAEKLPHLKLA